MISDIKLRQPDREALAAAVAQYQAGGGRIQQLSHTERAPPSGHFLHQPRRPQGQGAARI